MFADGRLRAYRYTKSGKGLKALGTDNILQMSCYLSSGNRKPIIHQL